MDDGTHPADRPPRRLAPVVAPGRVAQSGRHADHRGRALVPRRDPRRVHDRHGGARPAGRIRGRHRQRCHLAGTGLSHRAAVGADARSRRNRPQRGVRRLGVGAAAGGRGRRLVDVAPDRDRAGRADRGSLDAARTRRRRLARPTSVTAGPQTLGRRQRDRRAGSGVRPVRRGRPRRAPPCPSIGRRTEPAPLAP